MKKSMKNSKGITLIALVITIIILLILAGVTLRIVFNGGIIDKSQNAVDKYAHQSQNEAEKLNYIEEKFNEIIGVKEEKEDPVDPENIGDKTDYGEISITLPENPTDDEIKKFEEEIEEIIDDEFPEEHIGNANIALVYDREDLEAVGTNTTHTVKRTGASYAYMQNSIYVLMEDIDLSEANWTPITNVLTNIFYGNNHKISNMTITGQQTKKDIGLFSTSSARISKLTMENVKITSLTYSTEATGVTGSNNTGAIVGCIVGKDVGYVGSGIISKCKVNGTISDGTYQGGLAGAVQNSSTKPLRITSCTNEITVNGGGILGIANSNITIEKCTNNIIGTKSYSYIAGMISTITDGNVKIYECINNAEMDSSSYGSGIISYVNGKNVNLDIEKCANKGNIAKGGIIGTISKSSTCKINNCINTGNIDQSSNSSIGGIVGNLLLTPNVSVTYCRNEGTINGNNDVGGIIGYVDNQNSDGTINISNCINYGTRMGSGDIGGIIGDAHIVATLIIKNCENYGNDSVTSYHGGIVGYIQSSNDILVDNCINHEEANLSGGGRQGGIIGYLKRSEKGSLTISNCTNNAENIATDNSVGGIIGYISSDSNVEIGLIKNCINTGTNKGTFMISGGVAQCIGLLKMEDCINEGLVQAYNGNNAQAGGIMGYGSAGDSEKAGFKNCINRGTIEGLGQPPNFLGGIVGYNTAYWKYENCINYGIIKGIGYPMPIVGGILGAGRISNIGCQNLGSFEFQAPSEARDNTYVNDIVGDDYDVTEE